MAQIASELIVAPAPRVSFGGAFPRWRVVLWLGALTALVGVVAASYLAYTGSVATSSYSIQKLEVERELWRTRNEQLRVELGKVRSLTWVEHEAVTRLKMHRPSSLLYIEVGEGAAAAGPPAGADQTRPASAR